jgi:hypothetical protein
MAAVYQTEDYEGNGEGDVVQEEIVPRRVVYEERPTPKQMFDKFVRELPTIPGECNPVTQPLRCPLIFFIILAVLSLIVTVVMSFSFGHNVHNGRRWGSFIVSFIVQLFLTFIIGWIIYRLCATCHEGWAWLVFILAIFLPFILLIISAVIIVAILGTVF